MPACARKKKSDCHSTNGCSWNWGRCWNGSAPESKPKKKKASKKASKPKASCAKLNMKKCKQSKTCDWIKGTGCRKKGYTKNYNFGFRGKHTRF